MAADLRQQVYQILLAQGLTPQQALGGLYGLMGESGGGLAPKAFNPKDPGGSIGFGQWNGDRRSALQATAAAMGTTEFDPAAQLAYFQKEISPGGRESGAIDAMKRALTVADAASAWTTGYERPKVNNYLERVRLGSRYASLDPSGQLALRSGQSMQSPPGLSLSGATMPGSAAVAGATPVAPTPTLGQQFAAGDYAGIAKQLTTKPAAASGQAQGKSPIEQVTSALGGGEQQQTPAPEAPRMQMPSPSYDYQSAAMTPAAQQLFAQITAALKPLTWSRRPFGAEAGPQGLGTTLNTMQDFYG